MLRVGAAAAMVCVLLAGGCVMDAKELADDSKDCRNAAEKPDFPQAALVAKFDEINEDAELENQPGFDPEAAAARFEAMSNDDARGMLWALCMTADKGGRCTDPAPLPDGRILPPETCSIKSGQLSSPQENPFLK